MLFMGYSAVVTFLWLWYLTQFTVRAHLTCAMPSVWGIQNKEIAYPLWTLNKQSLDDAICHGEDRPDDAPKEILRIGGVFKRCAMACGSARLETTLKARTRECKAERHPEHEGTGIPVNGYSSLHTWHDGKHQPPAGVTISVNRNYDKDKTRFEVVAMDPKCPSNTWKRCSFKIRSDIKPCKDCVCSYAWIPEYAFAEGYMGCFNCDIVGTPAKPVGRKIPLRIPYYEGGTPTGGRATVLYRDIYKGLHKGSKTKSKIKSKTKSKTSRTKIAHHDDMPSMIYL